MIDKRKREAGKEPERATREEAEDGYVGLEEERPPMSRRRRPSVMYKPAIIVGIGVLLISYLMIGAISVSKDDFTKNIQNMIVTIEDTQKEVTASRTAVDQAIAGLSSTVTTQVNGALKQVSDRLTAIEGNAKSAQDVANSAKSSVDTANSNVATLTTGVNDLITKMNDANAKITALQTQLTASEVRLVALEDKLTTSEDVEDALVPFTYSVNLRDDGFPTNSANRTSLSLRVILTNKTNKDIEDISMEFEVEVYGDNEDIVTSFRPRVSLSGWRVKEWGMDYIILKGTGISIEDNDKYSKVMNIEMQFTGETNGEAEIDEDYVEITNWSYE